MFFNFEESVVAVMSTCIMIAWEHLVRKKLAVSTMTGLPPIWRWIVLDGIVVMHVDQIVTQYDTEMRFRHAMGQIPLSAAVCAAVVHLYRRKWVHLGIVSVIMLAMFLHFRCQMANHECRKYALANLVMSAEKLLIISFPFHVQFHSAYRCAVGSLWHSVTIMFLVQLRLVFSCLLLIFTRHSLHSDVSLVSVLYAGAIWHGTVNRYVPPIPEVATSGEEDRTDVRAE